ncbi:MAG TPA: HEAT repeat domain-containing protein [Actinomycetota bacterium]|nr:HEAT repeat domain-containing protein [Actinomycetota bacterium]
MARLQSLLSIRPGEGRLAFRLLALMLIGMSGAMIGANGVESLFFTRFGPEFLPYLYLVLGPLTFGVMVAMGPLVSGEALRFLVRLPLVLAAVLVVARVSLWTGASWLYPASWLVMMVLWTSQVMASWALAGAVSDTRQAKRLFPLYGAGLIAGGVVGGLATGPLAQSVGAENLLWAWAAALLVVHLLARTLTGADAPRRRRRTARPSVVRQMAGGFRDVWEWPLLRWMSVSLTLFALLYFTLTLLFAEAATARFPRADDLAGFLGVFQGAVSGAALMVSLLGANRLFARFGLPAAVLVLTVIYAVGFSVIAVWPTFTALLAFRFAQMVWVNGVWATGWQALFNVVPAERRARTRTFMDGGPLQAGVVLAGGLLLLADRVLAPGQLAVVGAVGGVLALAAMWRARRAYGGALVEALRTGNPDVFRAEEEPFGGFRTDAEAHAALVAGTREEDPAVRRISAEILADVADEASAAALVAVLEDPEPEIRAAAVRGVADAGVALERLVSLLDDPDPEVRAEAARALLAIRDEQARPTLHDMARDPRPEWRAAAVTALGRAGDPDALDGLDDPEPSVRRAAADGGGWIEPDRAVQPLLGALEDADPSVRAAAARALAALGTSAQEVLVRALDHPQAEPHALEALAASPGSPPSGLIDYALRQQDAAQRDHRLWAAVANDTDDPRALLAHALRHRALTHATNAIRAMARFGNAAALIAAVENLGSPEPEQRANALETLESVGDPDVVRPLLPLWDPSGRPSGDRRAALTELLDDPDPWIRACAVVAWSSGDGAPPERLRRLADDDPDPLVRRAATLALEDDPVKTLSTLPLLERVVFLRKVPMFAQLSPADLKHIADVASEHAYPDGEVLAEQGEPGDEMHIVVAGEIRVMVAADGRPGREVARRTAGEYVGEMAILNATPRMASLVAAGPVRTLSLDRRAFERILRERPDVSLGVMRVLSDRLRAAHAGDVS